MAGNNGEIRIKREIEDDDDPLSIVDGEYIFKKSEFSWNILIMRYTLRTGYIFCYKSESLWVYLWDYTPQNIFVQKSKYIYLYINVWHINFRYNIHTY